MLLKQPVKICIVGAGSRGNAYSQYVKAHPEKAVITAVAEPREYYRRQMAKEFNIDDKNSFNGWQELAAREKIADAVLICTHDNMHIEPTIAFIEKGYDILLEKPMASTEHQCKKIVDAAVKKRVIFGVCHVLRYTQYTQKLKTMLDSGVIGDIVSIQHLEPIGYWHFAHSYVRGNWRNEEESSCMLLAKSCHDLDWLRYIAGSKFTKISSFGSLRHFKSENKPQHASGRCVSCGFEEKCPYSAKKIYFKRAKQNQFNWPVNVITQDLTIKGVNKAIADGPYGRCVYDCDNDVVDNQVVNMEFENGITASFTVTAFTEMTDRRTRIFGTKGEINGNGSQIQCYNFLNDTKEVIDVNNSDGSILTNHGGGDLELMKAFVNAVAAQDQNCILSGPLESLETHLSVFAAENSRKKGQIISL